MLLAIAVFLMKISERLGIFTIVSNARDAMDWHCVTTCLTTYDRRNPAGGWPRVAHSKFGKDQIFGA